MCPFPEEGEVIICAYCGKEAIASEDMDYWFCVSEIKAGEESLWEFLCCRKCLKAWVIERDWIRFERERQQRKEREWMREEKSKEV